MVTTTPFPFHTCPEHPTQLTLTTTDLNKYHWEEMATSTRTELTSSFWIPHTLTKFKIEFTKKKHDIPLV